jgi:hypothetical protein
MKEFRDERDHSECAVIQLKELIHTYYNSIYKHKSLPILPLPLSLIIYIDAPWVGNRVSANPVKVR